MNFDREALSRANKVLRLLQGTGAIDELGLGRMRDFFSNGMFPGMSVLQTHAKYFVLLPALYAWLERKHITDAANARKVIREHEIALTRRLAEGSAPGTHGIIGADMLAGAVAAPAGGDGYVKLDPTQAYQRGMAMYGLIPASGDVWGVLAERSAIRRKAPKRMRQIPGSEQEDCDSDDLLGLDEVFATAGVDYAFSSRTPLDILLTSSEAHFLKEKITAHTQGTMLCYLLENGLTDESVTGADFHGLADVLSGSLTPDLLHTYRMALRFSRFGHLLRLRFAMRYDKEVNAPDAALNMESQFHDHLATHAGELTPSAIEETISFISRGHSDKRDFDFLRDTAGLIASENWEKLDEIIAEREVRIKGPRRSKLRNASSLPRRDAFPTPKPMGFRWSEIASTVLKEIHQGINGNG